MSTRNNNSGAIDKKLCQPLPSKLTSSLCKYTNNSAIKVHRTMQAKNPRNFHAPLFNDVVINTTASHLLAEFCTDKCQNDERSYHEYPNSRINFYDQWEHVNSCLIKERSCHERTFPTFPETSRSFAPFPWTSRVVLKSCLSTEQAKVPNTRCRFLFPRERILSPYDSVWVLFSRCKDVKFKASWWIFHWIIKVKFHVENGSFVTLKPVLSLSIHN